MNVAPIPRHQLSARLRDGLIEADPIPPENPMRPGYKCNSRRRVLEMLPLIALFAFAVSATPMQALEVNAIEGRWQASGDQTILDIIRCGRDYCGQHVKLPEQTGSRGTCDNTVLTIKPAISDTGSPTFEGKLDLGDGGGPYPVSLHLSEDARTLTILGKKEKSPIWSRVIPLMISLARIGNATCQPPLIN
jgi:uncharacterized protein (DUF2147 family)